MRKGNIYGNECKVPEKSKERLFTSVNNAKKERKEKMHPTEFRVPENKKER